MNWPDTENFKIQHGQTIVFAGDSITHWYGGPEREDHPLGLGYCAMASNMLSRIYQNYELRMHNRGISGNRVGQLLERAEQDILALKPDWVSLLIGINDTASQTNPGTPLAEFTSHYRDLVDLIKPHAQIVIMTPFFLNVPDGSHKIIADLQEKIDVVTEIAADYADVFIPLHTHFENVGTKLDPQLLLPDGVHPSQMGHGFIADHWRAAMGAQKP